jgi:hypothetical protein
MSMSEQLGKVSSFSETFSFVLYMFFFLGGNLLWQAGTTTTTHRQVIFFPYYLANSREFPRVSISISRSWTSKLVTNQLTAEKQIGGYNSSCSETKRKFLFQGDSELGCFSEMQGRVGNSSQLLFLS